MVPTVNDSLAAGSSVVAGQEGSCCESRIGRSEHEMT